MARLVHRDRMPVRNTMVTDGVTPWINAGRRIYDNGLGKALPVATSNPLAVGFDPAFSIYNTLTTPILLMGNIAGSSPAGFQYANTTVQTRSYDSAVVSPDNFDRSLADGSIFPLTANVTGQALQNRLHADIRGFRHEADAFFAWVQENRIGHLTIVCGDRHWQYVSRDPAAQIEEWSVGAATDAHAGGWSEETPRPEHRFLRIKFGGFLSGSVAPSTATAPSALSLRLHDTTGKVVFTDTKPAK